MTRVQIIILATLGSAALLIGALIFQAFGFAPCQLCMWQRWPHVAALIAGPLALWRPMQPWPLLGALGAAGSAAVAAFHTGVERKWWAGLESCSGDTGALTGDLLATTGPRVIPCDEIPWQMLGLSMANFNLIFSAGLAGLWIWALIRR